MMSNTETAIRQHTISLYVSNKPGVLIRVSLVFARRGYNIDSLVVSSGHDPNFSHMNIAATGDAKTLDQILKQLNKLVDVVHATDNIADSVIMKELLLIKLSCGPEKRHEILQIASAFNSEIVDMSDKTITLEVSGDSDKLDKVHSLCSYYGVVEMVRSGKILIAKGEKIT
ncbi:MAG: acetolactate synthase small subunit [Spirochaetales bacterium]|nr:acetolactate synthase small subunit [Spirochaetales bacterium]